MSIFRRNKTYSLARKFFEVEFFVLVVYQWSCIHSNAFIVKFFSDYHANVCLKYELSYPFIPYILIIQWPESLMYLYIITLYVNDNADNRHNSSSHLYFLLHPSEVSYIILSFIKNLSSYIQWIHFFTWSHVVASF